MHPQRFAAAADRAGEGEAGITGLIDPEVQRVNDCLALQTAELHVLTLDPEFERHVGIPRKWYRPYQTRRSMMPP